MPNPGDVKVEYNRIYIYTEPLNTGPGTWRLAVPAETAASGGGGGGPQTIVEGELPVVARPVGNTTTVSLDFQNLDDRTTTRYTSRRMNVTT